MINHSWNQTGKEKQWSFNRSDWSWGGHYCLFHYTIYPDLSLMHRFGRSTAVELNILKFWFCPQQVQHWRLRGHWWSHQHHQNGQLALPAGYQHRIPLPLQRQRFGPVGGRSWQGLSVHHLSVFHHDQPNNHRLRQHCPHHGRREDLLCGHDDGGM